ncbi:T-cell surface glycoprotein CD3 epsilon chain-like [Melanotaenia boesemani]|uniref:T-cell surface glycoprotein CD3 epsilon chain-like n=1 Tax=Melanotaenia boesemani TaxID=1250792 RepID=UPI001C05CB50|nr:T-cell surface glycoprotein CD3 epsilon chain-like [Melanotaenia boesemani]
MEVQAVLVVLFMFASTVKTDENGNSVEGKVEFWRKNVILTCPGKATWNDIEKMEVQTENTIRTEYTQPLKGYCEYDDNAKTIKYRFYVKGKACENCFELDATVFMGVIIVDVVGTAVVMMMIYKCSKKTSSDKRSHSPKPPLPSGHRPPPTVPSRDYESLNPHTRAADTYSTVVNRMG